LKVVHINSTDIKGGAAIACMSINSALNKVGIESSILVQKKYGNVNLTVGFTDAPISKIKYFFRFLLDYFSIYFLTVKKRGRFSFPYFGTDISKHHQVKEADIIHLHWINGGFFSLRTFRQLAYLKKPVVWTLHDMWAFTGGCHYSGECNNYLTECKNCPSLKFPGVKDLSYRIFKGKFIAYKNLNLQLVTCSNWLSGEVVKSKLLSNITVDVIPNPIDTEIYRPVDKKSARKKLNLSVDKMLILFGTMTLKEERKGFLYLQKSLTILYNKYPELRSNIEVIVFGSFNKNEISKIPFKANFFGRIKNVETLVNCYNSADVFVAPSLEDNLPNTVMESLACGVPVAAFNIGGMPDMIEHKKNGFLAVPKSAESLADGILWLLKETKDFSRLNEYALNKVVEKFSPEIIGKKYKQLYLTLLSKNK